MEMAGMAGIDPIGVNGRKWLAIAGMAGDCWNIVVKSKPNEPHRVQLFQDFLPNLSDFQPNFDL